ncbi:hypothetical protein [Methylophilus sp. QUAN]|uniref:hypothetical protein n=1 Tax=Methylophilus sp. QUAN TaxID=2781020 RepID=UPI0018905354|nr:hypothetical protein [Methylophilus sp. QUAN]MBF4989786.1 hypothetical protein [Methylophilus sp. QUAN]
MQDFLDKLTSYNLFNNLLPGVIFLTFFNELLSIDLLGENLAKAFFISYFVGLIIGRIGSLIIEPILKKVGFIKFASYENFVEASKKDPKIDILSESNNIYRVIIATFVLILIAIGYEKLANECVWFYEHRLIIFSVAVLLLFLFSYRKQTAYINKRVASAK